MKKLRIKIGGNPIEDIREIMRDPSKHRPGTHTVYFKSAEDLHEMLSPKRLEMLQLIISHARNPRSVGEISASTNRKQEAVSRDATTLEKHEFVEKIRRGRNTLLKAKYDTLEICLAK